MTEGKKFDEYWSWNTSSDPAIRVTRFFQLRRRVQLRGNIPTTSGDSFDFSTVFDLISDRYGFRDSTTILRRRDTRRTHVDAVKRVPRVQRWIWYEERWENASVDLTMTFELQCLSKVRKLRVKMRIWCGQLEIEKFEEYRERGNKDYIPSSFLK